MDQQEFYDRYRQYSTADLIIIIREKDSYQPAAVLAAEQLLQEREVSSVDEEGADQYFREREAKRMVATAKVDSYKATVADWVEPLARPAAELQPYKWYRLFLVAYGVLYLINWYGFLREQFSGRGFDFYSRVFEVTGLLLDSLIFVLVIKRHRWGWMLLVVQNTILMIERGVWIGESVRFIRFGGFNPVHDGFIMLINFAFVMWLWRKPMADFFGVRAFEKKRTLGVGIVLGLIMSWVFFH